MLIVDSQIHIWENAKMSAHHRQIPTYSKDDALKEMAEAGVDAALIHPPSTLPQTVPTAIEAARQHPDRFAILGHFAVEKPENRGLIDTWKQQPGMLGLRFTFNQPHQQSWWTDGTLDWLWPAAERAGIPIGLIATARFGHLARIAERYPGLRLHIDHMGRSSGTADDAAFADLPDMLALARFPNVAVKLSSAPSYSSEAYPWRNIHPHIRRIFDAFGPQRSFWGTDITRMPCSYRQCVTMFTEELPWLSGDNLELVMGRALCKWVGWELPALTTRP
jgi:predicted TIM-barrel fold metal-dependent hydrolase